MIYFTLYPNKLNSPNLHDYWKHSLENGENAGIVVLILSTQTEKVLQNSCENQPFLLWDGKSDGLKGRKDVKAMCLLKKQHSRLPLPRQGFING